MCTGTCVSQYNDAISRAQFACQNQKHRMAVNKLENIWKEAIAT